MSSDDDHNGVRVFGGDGPETDAWQDFDDHQVTRTSKAVTSQQHDTDDPHERVDYYEPPYSATRLALLLERSETHARCVQAKAQGVAGHGFDPVPHEEADSETPAGESAVRDFWFGPESKFQLGIEAQPASPTSVLENAWTDYESIGWLALEALINDTTAEPTGLAHIPAHTIRRRVDAPGYVQIDPDSNIIEGYFAPAGARYGDDQLFVDADTGDTGSSIAEIGTPANELLVYRNYSALAPHYGVPDIVPALETLAGDIAARTYNRRFFENDAVPRFAVIVEGGELTDQAWTELEEKFHELKDNEEAHRGVILEAVSGVASSFEDAHDVSLRIEPLTVGTEEDASFIEYRKENETDIRKAHDVPPVVLNRTEQINYANAKAQRVQFAQDTIRPKQEKFAAYLYRTLHKTMLGVDGWTLEFELHGGQNEMREAEIQKLRIEGTAGTLTVDEARDMQGLDPLGPPEGNLLVAELAQSSGAGGAGAPSSGSGEAGDVEAIRRQQRAADLGYSVTDRADGDD